MSIIRVESAIVLRGRTRAIDGVTLAVEPGQWVAVIGRNGSGKSTLLSAIAGLIPLTGGVVSGPRAIGMVLQRTSLDKLLTIRENARFFAFLHGLSRSEADRRIEELSEASSLSDRMDERVGTLSGGLARRADLLRACVVRPEMLVLDEPTAGLDEPSRRAFLEQVRGMQHMHKPAILWATHDDTEARAADRVIVLETGRIVADGSPRDLDPEQGLRRVRFEGKPAKLLTEAEATRAAQEAISRGETVSVEQASLLDRFTIGSESAVIGSVH